MVKGKIYKISWDCYTFDNSPSFLFPLKAEEIINQGLKEQTLRDRADVVARAIEIYTALGKEQQAAELEMVLKKANKAIKIGRNDPCPCGNGKKYKKCCGK